MKNSYQRSLAEVLKWEGGYVNHPKDPGGATNKGITQATYNAYLGPKRQRSVKIITDAEVADIYKHRYWDVVRGDDLPAGLDFAVFDFAVNSGPTRAIRFLQHAVGVKVDGELGPLTLRAAKSCDVSSVIRKLCANRLYYLKLLKTWPTFGKGWERRVVGVEALALKMAIAAPPVAQEAPQPLPATQVPQALSTPLLDAENPSKRWSVWTWLKSLFKPQ